MWRIQKLIQIPWFIYFALSSFPLKRYVTSICCCCCCCCSWIWFCCLPLVVCFVTQLIAMLDCWHRLPCRKLCRNQEHISVFWTNWQASQCWWGPLHVLLYHLQHPSCHVLVVCPYLCLQIKTVIFPWCIIGLWSSDYYFSWLIILINALVI